MVAAGGNQSRDLSGTRRRVQWGSQPVAGAGTRIDPRPLAMPVPDRTTNDHSEVFLKPMDLKRMARVPFATVLRWLTVGHPRAGLLPSIDLAETGKRHSYRIRWSDWCAFLNRLQTVPKSGRLTKPLPRPPSVTRTNNGMFRY